MRFIEDHWGDLIGLLLLYTGVVLALLSTTHLGNAQPVTHLGESLVLAGMGVLKLRGRTESDEHPSAKERSNDARSEAAAGGARPPGNV